MLNARIRISLEIQISCTWCWMPGSGFRWRVGSPIPYLMLNARIRISAERLILCTWCWMPRSGFRWNVRSSVPDAECQDPDFGGESDLLYGTWCWMPRSGFRWRVRYPVPDAECQDPDYGGESDLLYLMLNARIRISVESRIFCTWCWMPGSGFRQTGWPSVPDAKCQDPDFCGESDLLSWLDAGGEDPDPGGESDLMYRYLMLNARIRISVESRIFCTGSTLGARKRASLGLVTSTTGHSLCVSSLYIGTIIKKLFHNMTTKKKTTFLFYGGL